MSSRAMRYSANAPSFIRPMPALNRSGQRCFFPLRQYSHSPQGGVLDRRDPISRLEMSVTGIHDHTAELMAGHSVLPGSNTIAPDHMPIASADARIGHLDQRVPRFSLRHGFFRDRNFFSYPPLSKYA